MIADAWYMVAEYHLNLGPNDTLERLVHHIYNNSDLKPCEKKNVILEHLKTCKDREVIQKTRTLTYNVPYRLQCLVHLGCVFVDTGSCYIGAILLGSLDCYEYT